MEFDGMKSVRQTHTAHSAQHKNKLIFIWHLKCQRIVCLCAARHSTRIVVSQKLAQKIVCLKKVMRIGQRIDICPINGLLSMNILRCPLVFCLARLLITSRFISLARTHTHTHNDRIQMIFRTFIHIIHNHGNPTSHFTLLLNYLAQTHCVCVWAPNRKAKDWSENCHFSEYVQNFENWCLFADFMCVLLKQMIPFNSFSIAASMPILKVLRSLLLLLPLLIDSQYRMCDVNIQRKTIGFNSIRNYFLRVHSPLKPFHRFIFFCCSSLIFKIDWILLSICLLVLVSLALSLCARLYFRLSESRNSLLFMHR